MSTAGIVSLSVDGIASMWRPKNGKPVEVCVKFDGMKSPNMKAGATKCRILLLLNRLGSLLSLRARLLRGFGSTFGGTGLRLSGQNRAVWELCTKYRVTEKHTFATSSTVIAGLDPAFGGDRCVLRFAKYGDLPLGSWAWTLRILLA